MRIRHHLEELIGPGVRYLHVKPNESSHASCLDRISTLPDEALVVFLGHGRSDSLQGGVADACYSAFSAAEKEADPEKYFHKSSFINFSNIEIFSNKKIICLSCNSNGPIAEAALAAGALAFMGFGHIPTSVTEFEALNVKGSATLTSEMKSNLTDIVKRSLGYAYANDMTFEDLGYLIEFAAQQRIVNSLRTNGGLRKKDVLATHLYNLKNDLAIKGNRSLKVFR
jgi:hypothetical protein